MYFSKVLSCSILFCCVALCGFSQNYTLQHNTLSFVPYVYSSQTPFVPANTVIQDHLGYMWFGTHRGLYRYNGYESTLYKSDLHSSNSIIHNEVNALLEDNSGKLWVGTSGGLTCFDVDRQNTTHYLHALGQKMTYLFQDRDNVLWVGSNKGLYSLNPNDLSFKHYPYNDNNPNSLPELPVLSIVQDQNGMLWISFEISEKKSALTRFNPADETVTLFYSTTQGEVNPFANWLGTIYEKPIIDYINTMCVSSTGAIWMGPWWGQLIRFDPNSYLFEEIIPSNYQHEHLHTRIRKILEDDNGILWIASDDFGLSRYDPQTNTVFVEQPDRFRNDSLRDAKLTDLYKDSFENLWILSSGLVERYDPYKRKYPVLQFRSQNQYAGMFYDIVIDHQDMMWMATAEGLHRYDFKSKNFLSFYHDPSNINSLPQNRVTAICLENKNQLWIGTESGGVCIINTDTLQIKSFEVFPNVETDNNGYIREIETDHDGNIWIGTLYSGLVKYHPETNTNERYFDLKTANDDQEEFAKFGEISKVFCSSSGTVWIGTSYKGLYKYVEDTNSFYHFDFETNFKPDNTHLFGKTINDMAEDRDGNIWIATNTSLNRLNPSTNTFEHWNSGEELVGIDVKSIQYKEDHTIWLSTRFNGILQFDIASQSFIGVYNDFVHTSDTFVQNSSWQRLDGTLYFGSMHGIATIDPSMQKPLRESAPPVTRIESVNAMGDIQQGNSISLPYWQNSLSIQYSVVHYADPTQNRSKYALVSDSQKEVNWIESFGSNTVEYFDLSPGNYTFQIAGANNDGIWMNQPSVLSIKISAPYWETWWFRIVSVISVFGLIIGLFYWRLYRINQAKLLLENEVIQRTAALVAERDYSNQLVVSSPVIIIGYRVDGTVSFINPFACQLIGITEKQAIGQPWWSLIPNQHEQEQLKSIHFDHDDNLGAIFELTLTFKMGKTHHMIWRFIHHYDDKGEIQEIIAFGNDITEQIEKEIIEISNREQQKIGQEIHDSLCQRLTGIGLMCESLFKSRDKFPNQESALVHEIRNQIKNVTNQSYDLARGLYLSDLEHQDFAGAVRKLSLSFQELFSIPCNVTHDPAFHVADFNEASQIYRIIQEALSNALKYSQANNIQITLMTESCNNVVEVIDDGIGFEPVKLKPRGMGINIMQFRARMINAKFTIESQLGYGTTVRCSITNES